MSDLESDGRPPGPVLATLVLGLGIFLVPFDVTVVIVALPGIASSLALSVDGAAWVIDAYSLAFTGALLAAGAFADRFGRRRSLLSGNAAFLVASLACGLAMEGWILLVARAVQGVAAAFLVTGALALIAGTFPEPQQRARAFGTVGVLSGAAMALGPTLGGLLASWIGWPWIFYANIPFCIVIALAVPQLIAEAREPNGRPFDPVGVILLTLALGLAIDALLRRDASPALRLSCLAGGTAAAGLFVVQQWRRPHPVLDPRVFATPAMAAVAALLTAIQFGYWALLVYLPLFLSAGLAMSMDVAGMALLAATLPMLVVPPIGSRLVSRWEWRRFFLVAFGFIVAGDVFLALATIAIEPAWRLAVTVAGMLTIGTGAALANPQMAVVALALTPSAHAGMTSAMTMVVRQAGFSISIAVLGATLASPQVAESFATPFTLAGLTTLLAAIAAAVVIPRKPDPSPAGESGDGSEQALRPAAITED